MTHPLQLSPDYVSIDKRKPALPKNKKGPHSCQVLSRKYDRPISYFYYSTVPRRARAFLILGKGDVEKGYLRYIKLAEGVLEEFQFITSFLKREQLTMKFSLFLKKDKSYISGIVVKVKKNGIERYDTLLATRNINKQYKIFLKEIK